MANIFKNDSSLSIGFAGALTGRRADGDKLSDAERKMLEEAAERLLQEHRETLKSLGDE